MTVDRYASHGLHANPFAVPDGSAAADEFFVDRGLDDPPPPGSATLVQVLGEKGAGKSTQVLAWRRSAPGPYHYVPSAPYRSRWARPPVGQLVYGDEIDRMPAPVRRHWFRKLADRHATVVAGTHRDLTSWARRAGLAVVTHHLGPADLATVRAVLTGRIRCSSMQDAAIAFSFTTAEIATIHRHAHGSLRAAELLAHEMVARRVAGDCPPGLVSAKGPPG